MKLRTHHLVCFLILLSASCMAESQAMRREEYTLGGRYMSALLAHDAAEQAVANHLAAQKPQSASALDLAVEARLAHRAVWTMTPPAAQAVALHSTSSGM